MAKRLPAVYHRFGLKLEPSTAKAISDSVVEGMLPDHFLGRSGAVLESAIRSYVLVVSHKSGFGVFLGFSLEKQTSGRSTHKKIDAVLVYGNQKLIFDIKTIRKKAVCFNLQEDLGKFRRFPDEVA